MTHQGAPTLAEQLVEAAKTAMREGGHASCSYGLKLAIEAVAPLVAIHTLRGAADDRSRGSTTFVPRSYLRELADAIEADADIRHIVSAVSDAAQ